MFRGWRRGLAEDRLHLHRICVLQVEWHRVEEWVGKILQRTLVVVFTFGARFSFGFYGGSKLLRCALNSFAAEVGQS